MMYLYVIFLLLYFFIVGYISYVAICIIIPAVKLKIKVIISGFVSFMKSNAINEPNSSDRPENSVKMNAFNLFLVE